MRPDPVEWENREAPHGAPLVASGQLQAAMRDALWFERPDTRKHKYAHIIVASRRMMTSHGPSSLWEAAACDPTRIPLDVDGLVWDAASVSAHLRCRRAACAALYAQADRAMADRAIGDAG